MTNGGKFPKWFTCYPDFLAELQLVFPGPVWSGFFAIFGWTATATSCLYIESVKKPDRTDAKPQKTGLNQSQLVFEKTGLTIGCDL